MSIPVSSGIGTGAAQVYDTSRSYNAMGKVLDANADLMEYQNKMAALKKRDEQEAKERDYTKIAALQKAAEVDYGNMKPVYVDLTKAEAQAFKDKYAGKYEQILNNNPEIVNEYYKDLANLKANVSKRVESWEQQKEIIARITKNPEKYKNSQIALAEELYLNPDTDMSKYQSSFGEKLQIGNPFNDAAKTYEAIFYKPKTSVETDKGIYANTGNVYEDEQVSLAEFKKQLAANPELKVRMYAALEDDADIEKDSRGVPTIAGQEQLLQKSYKLTKALLPESKEIVNKTKEQKDDSSYGYDNKTWNVVSFIDSNNNENIVVTDKKGKNLQIPQQKVKATNGKEYLLKNGVVQGIRVDNGTPIVKLSGVVYVKNDKDEFIEQPLMPKEMVLDETTWGNISAAIGANSTLDEFINSLPKSFKTKTTIDSKVLDISNNPIGSNKSNKPDPLNLGF